MDRSTSSKTVMLRIRRRIDTGAGLKPPDWVLESRVRERMDSLGLSAVTGYAEHLETDGELACLVELLRVGETRFFRHSAYVKALEEHVIPVLRESDQPLRAWSAGCATGEEPYTLAMLLTRGLGASRNVTVLASDLSRASLDIAKAAQYPDRALESVPSLYRNLFDRVGDNVYQLGENTRRLVEFEHRNLSRGPYPRGFDLIWCRNVLIYFSPEAKAAALKRLVTALKPGGFLFLGYSESLREVSGLSAISGEDGPIYQRASGSARAKASPPKISVKPRPATISTVIEPPAQSKSSKCITLSGDYHDADRLARELALTLDASPDDVIVDLDGADYLGAEAATVLRRAQATADTLSIGFVLQATRPGPTRFLRRHGLQQGDRQ